MKILWVSQASIIWKNNYAVKILIKNIVMFRYNRIKRINTFKYKA